MRQILATSTATFRALTRSRLLFYAALALCGLILAIRYFSPESALTASGFATNIKLTLFAMASFSALFCLVLGSTLLSESFENWSIHLIRVKPVAGHKLILGHALGLSLAAALLFLLNLLVSTLLFYQNFQSLDTVEKEKARATVFTTKSTTEAIRPNYLARAKALAESGDIETLAKKLKIADHELNAGQEKVLSFPALSFTEGDKNTIQFTGKLSGDVGHIKRHFSTIRLVFFMASSNQLFPVLHKFESGVKSQVKIPTPLLNSKQPLSISIINENRRGRVLYFDPVGYPEVCQESSGFISNWLKMSFITLTSMFYFSALGLLIGLMFSSPVGFFINFTYIIISSFTNLGILSTSFTDILAKIFISPFSQSVMILISKGDKITLPWLFLNYYPLILEFILILFTANVVYQNREVAATMRSK